MWVVERSDQHCGDDSFTYDPLQSHQSGLRHPAMTLETAPTHLAPFSLSLIVAVVRQTLR